MNLKKALAGAWPAVRDDLMDDLVAKLDAVPARPMESALRENAAAGQTAISVARRLDDAMCLECGPNVFKMRRLRARLRVVQAGPSPQPS